MLERSGWIDLSSGSWLLGVNLTPKPLKWVTRGHRAWSATRYLAEVHIQDGEILENALRRFKRKVLQEDIIREVKRHAFF